MKSLCILLLLCGALATMSHGAGPPGKTVDPAALGPAVPEENMAQQTGRQGVAIDELNNTLNTAETSGTVSSNLLTSTVTGTNIIGDNAFGSTSGIATVIQNSGNQNVIQSSFIMNLSIK
jgi:hypothetical protein